MSIEEACAKLAESFKEQGIYGKKVVAVGIGDQQIIIYLVKKFDVPESYEGWPIKAIVIGRIEGGPDAYSK